MQILVITLLAASLGFLIAWKMAKKISKPLADTAKIVRKIAERSNPAEDIKHNKDEAEQLASGVHYLAGLLDKTIDDLNDTNSSLKAMLRAIPCSVVAVDKDKKIIMINNMAKSFFGVSDDVEGKYFIECVRNVSLEKLIDTAIGTKKTVEDERPIHSMDAESIYKINVAPIKQQNKVIGAMLLAQDITEIRHLEMMRRDFAANVSHELKTPLTVIKGFLETIKSESDMNADTRERFLDIIGLETDRLSRLIEDILTLSEIESGGINIQEKVHIDPCINKSVELLRGKAEEKQINIEVSLGCKEDIVLGSADRISQMAINLIDNAIKYNKLGGRVVVSTRKSGDNCIITVEDNGIGISIEDQRRLFERFYRADKSRSREMGGTGLGLSIVKHIASSMKGSVSAQSTPGKGSVFTVTLPLD